MRLPSPAVALQPQQRNDNYSLSGSVVDSADGTSASGTGDADDNRNAPTGRPINWTLKCWDNLYHGYLRIARGKFREKVYRFVVWGLVFLLVPLCVFTLPLSKDESKSLVGGRIIRA